MIMRLAASALASTLLLGACAPDDQADVGSSSDELRTTVFNTVWNGGSADAYGGDALSSWSVGTWENQSRGVRTAYVSYNLYAADPTSETCVTETWDRCELPGTCAPEEYVFCYYTRASWEYGYGPIPTSALRISGDAASLDVALPTAGFATEHCTADHVAGTFECTPGGGSTGSITLSWAATDWWSNSRNGSESSTYGQYVNRTSGVWTSTSAVASGTFFGAEVNSEGGLSHGTSSNKSMVKP